MAIDPKLFIWLGYVLKSMVCALGEKIKAGYCIPTQCSKLSALLHSPNSQEAILAWVKHP